MNCTQKLGHKIGGAVQNPLLFLNESGISISVISVNPLSEA
ncbi:hypothetical protein [Fusobacterium canifelinum]